VLFDPTDRERLGWAIRASAPAVSEGNWSDPEAERMALAQRQLRRMEAIAEGEECRERALLRAVGEVEGACGRCDRCVSRDPSRDWSEDAVRVLGALQEHKGQSSKSLAEQLAERYGGNAEQWRWLSRRLVQEHLIAESDDGVQRLWLKTSGLHFLRTPWPLHWAA
jgi:ATP-dependent DNA helicase RecQ